MRVSDTMTFRQNIRAMNDGMKRLSKAQTKVSTQKALLRPSDSPADTERALLVRSKISSIIQHQTNLSEVGDRLDLLDVSLKGVQDIVGRLKDLAMTGANATQGTDEYKELSSEASVLAKELFSEANGQTGGRYLYSGDAPWKVPFVANDDGTYSYTGNTVPMTVEADDGIMATEGMVGKDIFMDPATYGGKDAFSMADAFVAALGSGDVSAMETAIADFGTVENSIIAARSGAGAVRARFDDSTGLGSRLADELLSAKDQLSKLEDADFAEAATELSSQEAVYQASLSVVARAAQRRTLVDLLR
jgi:flagellar hook-associated protein 3 FlgL